MMVRIQENVAININNIARITFVKAGFKIEVRFIGGQVEYYDLEKNTWEGLRKALGFIDETPIQLVN